VNVIALSLLCAALAFIALGFLGAGIDLHNNAVRTTATVLTVREIHDAGRGGGYHFDFTIEFTDLHGKHHTVRTGQISSDPVLPATGDHVDIYYASDHPSNLADVRLGSPGNDAFAVATIFGFLVIATPVVARLIRTIRRQIHARRRRRLITWPLDQK
jgi:hypothetical protein